MFKNLLNRILPAPAATPPAPTSPVQPPDDVVRADALIAEGDAREEAGDLSQAEALYRAAIAAAPGHARAHLYLGILLAARGEQDGAIAAYEQVLAIEPTHPFGNYNFARLQFLRGNFLQAEQLAREALRTKPDFAQAQVLLGKALESLGKLVPAAEAMRAATRLTPDDPGVWFNLGSLLLDLRRHEEAEEALRRHLQFVPDNPDALYMLSLVWRGHGSLPELLDALRAALRSDPDNLFYLSQDLFFLNYEEDVPAQEIFRRHAEYGRRLEREMPERFDAYPRSDEPGRRLRIGYVSGDFCLHPAMFFLLPVLGHHDRTRFEIFCYSTRRKVDHITRLVKKRADHWLDGEAMTDAALADAIHADQIDILVDLTGHTTVPRLGLFSLRPAPVQASWMGYLNTTGLTRMHYRLTDSRCDPAEISQQFHTERLMPLPVSQWCYQPLIESTVDAVGPLERNGYVTFGSFNDSLKLTRSMCQRWAQVLSRVPRSRLLIANVGSERRREAIRRQMTDGGITPDRYEFMPRVDLDKYPALVSLADVALDTFPYGGGTTTFDALWMGLPVVTALGSTPASRSAASILEPLSLGDWIAPAIDDFVDVAVARAMDHDTIIGLRRSLRARMEASPLTDAVKFTHDLETAYQAMWDARSDATAPSGGPAQLSASRR